MAISFKEFIGLSKEEQMYLSTTLNEELSANLKKKKMRELEKKLKAHDFMYDFIDGDYREWKRQHEMAQDIRKLLDLINDDDAKLLYKQYAKKGGCWNEVKAIVDNQKTITDRIEEAKEKHSLFPEMDKVQKNIALGFNGEGKVLANKHHFSSGDPYENTEKWIAPTKKRDY